MNLRSVAFVDEAQQVPGAVLPGLRPPDEADIAEKAPEMIYHDRAAGINIR